MSEPTSAWDLVREWLRPAEVDEVRRAVGERLIEDSDLLRAERAALIEMLEDFGTANGAKIKALRERAARSAALTRGSSKQRQLLEAQIRMLLAERELAGDGSQRASTEEQRVCAYVESGGPRGGGGGGAVLGAAALGGPPTSAPGGSLYAEPGETLRPGTSAGRSVASAPDVLEPIRDLLNAYDIDAVVHAVRGVFEDEQKELLDDIAELNMALEDEDAALATASDAKQAEAGAAPSLESLKTTQAALAAEARERDHAHDTAARLAKAEARTGGGARRKPRDSGAAPAAFSQTGGFNFQGKGALGALPLRRPPGEPLSPPRRHGRAAEAKEGGGPAAAAPPRIRAGGLATSQPKPKKAGARGIRGRLAAAKSHGDSDDAKFL